MAPAFHPQIVSLVAIVLLPLLCQGSPVVLGLARVAPLSHNVDINTLGLHDRLRHSRIVQSSSSSTYINYRLGGGLTLGLYYATIRLGSPLREFKVLLDTGSHVLWVPCTSERFAHANKTFDPRGSSTVHMVSCSDERCPAGHESLDYYCSSGDKLCSFNLGYEDNTTRSGYFVADLLHFQTNLGKTNSTVPVVFGCSTQAVDTYDMFVEVDGILGLGKKTISVMSQLIAQRVSRAFSLCLQGEGGGILVFGAISEPNIIYTPIIPSDQRVPVDSSVFATGGDRGTIVDSGSRLLYLAREAYSPFVDTVNAAVSQVAWSFFSLGSHCYCISSRLEFEGGAALLLTPHDYLVPTATDREWCLGVQTLEDRPGLTIIGDLILQNRIFVYDLEAQRIGWADYNCSMPVNVSTVDTATSGHGDLGDPRHYISVTVARYWIVLFWTPITFIILF